MTHALTRQEYIEGIRIMEEQLARVAKFRALHRWMQLYVWQREFVTATSRHYECCLMAANQIGKTLTGTLIDAMHLLGDYPDDWTGHRFDFAPLGWGLGYSMEKTRDLLQTALFGEYNTPDHPNAFAGGLVPKERILNWEMVGAVTNAARSVWVKHKLGTSKMQFWSYTQGQHAIMGDVVDFVHVDEEPKDPTIRGQLLTRTINGDKKRGGRIHYTFTPENGRTLLVIKFMDDPEPSQFFMQKGWADAPHMTPEKRERFLGQYPAHERKMRSEGYPLLGTGRIYDFDEELITCESMSWEQIPEHWYVVDGKDFGWDHPQAHVRLLEDRDNDVLYLWRAWKAARCSANDSWAVVKEWGPGAGLIPCAWPHDGLQHEKGRDDAQQQKQLYQKAGFCMMEREARWLNAEGEPGSLSVEQGILELSNLMKLGKFKVVRGLIAFFEEFRQYHRNEQGKIVKTGDDILDAVRTAYMMRRHAVRKADLLQPALTVMPQPIRPIGAIRR